MPRSAATNRLVQRNYNAALAGNNCRTTTVGLNINTSGASCAFWYYPIAADGNVAATFEDSANASVYRLNIESGTRRLFTWTTSGGVGRAYKPTYTINLNEWHYIVFTYANVDGANRRSTIYVDGVSIGTETSAGLADTSSRFSCSAGSTSRLVSDVRVFNYELSSDDVQKLYYQNINPATPVLNWLLTEGAGSSAADSSGNGWTGTITSAAWTGNTPMKARKLINGNKVRNGDFEYAPPFTAVQTNGNTWMDGSAAGSSTNDLFSWAVVRNATSVEARFDPTTVYSGSYSLRVSTLDTTGRIIVRQIANTSAANIQRYGVRVSPNTSYLVTARIKTNNVVATTGGNWVRYDANGSAIGSDFSLWTGNSSTQDWTLKTTTVTTGSTDVFMYLQFILCNTAGNISDAWYDEISITPVYPEGRVPANGNLVKNFDFEVIPTFTAAGTTSQRWIDGTAAGSTTNSTYKWSQIIDVTACAVSIDGTVSRSGTGSLKVDATDATGRGRGCYGSRTGTGASLLVSELNLYAIRVTPSTSITLTYYIKTLNIQGTGARIVVHEHAGDGVRNLLSGGTQIPGTADWQQITYTFTTAATTQYLVLSAEMPTAGAAQTVWFDDIYLAPTTNPGRVVIT